MMNWGKYIFCIVSAAILTLSCAQDEGNYVYRELDEPVITGLADIQVLTFERLLIEPGLGDVAEDDYVYEYGSHYNIACAVSSKPYEIKFRPYHLWIMEQ